MKRLPLLLLTLIPTGAFAQWALPRVSVTNLRATPAHSAELVSQVVMGTPLKVVSSKGQWLEVESPEGYRGFVIGNTLSRYSDADLSRWQSADRAVVSSTDHTWVYDNDSVMSPAHRVSDVVPGSIVTLRSESSREATLAVALPDGRCGFVAAADVTPLPRWAASASEEAIGRLPDLARAYMGTPYLWGGTSVKGMDCSGFTQMLYYRAGILLPRDASQQARVGTPVLTDVGSLEVTPDMTGLLRKGDLLFFGNPTTGRVTHVGLYAGDGRVIHSSGRVRLNSLLRSRHDFDPGLHLLSARRIEGEPLRELSVGSRAVYGIAPQGVGR